MKIEDLSHTTTYEKEITERLFYTTILSTTLLGLALIAITSMLCMSIEFSKLATIAIITVSFGSVFVLSFAKNITTALIGYHIMVISLGILISTVLKVTTYSIIMSALGTTIFISVFMMLVGLMFPKIFSKLRMFLLVALFGLIILRLFQLFTGLYTLVWIDYLACIIFMGLIGYDMHRARTVARTLENAIMVGVSLFLDIINIFLAVLNIKSKN